MRAGLIGCLLGLTWLAQPACAYDPYDPKNCNGVDWDDKHALAVAKVAAGGRAHFIKSPYDDDFKAATCPAATPTCRKTSYLVNGDLVLMGRTNGDFTCVTYQSPRARKQNWTTGWLPSASLVPVAPHPSPRAADWTGAWEHPGGGIEIAKGRDGKLHITGDQVVPTARDFHNGSVEAEAEPRDGVIAFADDGSVPFDKANEGACRVRMQRVGEFLLVEDNSGCGGASVSFTGLYRRTK